MKYIITPIFLLSLLLISCETNKETEVLPNYFSKEDILEIPDRTTDKHLLNYNNKTSLWTLNDQPYSGYAVSYHTDSTLQEKIGILNGKKENQTIEWYPDGRYKEIANYHNGKLHGEKQFWSIESGHVLVSQLNYHKGKAHGEQKKWYATGELFKKMNLNMGREEGIQQAYRKNGDLYANYEAKDGRTFGLKKASLCFGLEDENIQYEN